jgi:hypothetical protein
VFKPGALDDNGNQLGWNSVITCQDCHSTAGIQATGPHGSTQSWAVDTNYPYPYTLAVNSHLTTSGIVARMDAATVNASQVGTDPAVGNVSLALANAGLANAGTPGTQYAVICAKCHKLFDYTNAYTPGNYAPGSHGFTFTNATGIGNEANTAHSSHHFDLNNGAADCVNCHVAIPHGWVRPRLLVYGDTQPATHLTAGSNVTVTPVADAYPYWQGRGTIGVGNGTSGMGPLSVLDQHTLSNGGVLWTEAQCTACGGEHVDTTYLPASFSISATGTTSLTWVAETGPTFGIANVYVDGVSQGTVDLYSGSVATSQSVYTINGLTSGTHKLEVDWTGTKNPSATGTYINVAGLLSSNVAVAGGIVDEDKATFLGVWTTQAAGGGGFNDNDYQYSNFAGTGQIK